jgi:hypothetical protein
MKFFTRWLMALVCVALMWPHTLPAHAAPTTQSTLDSVAPQFLSSLPNMFGAEAWIVGGGYLYWSRCSVPPRLASEPAGAELAQSTGLWRWPLGGGSVTTLSNTGFCDTSRWAADNTGLYYVRQVGSNYNIYRHATSDPTNAALVYEANSNIVSIALDGGFVYALRDTLLFGYAIYRVPNNGGSMGFFGFAGNSVSNLIATNNAFYWFSDTQLMTMGKDCLADCIRALAPETGGQYLTNASSGGFAISGVRFPLWVNGASIRGYRCSIVIGGGCSNGNSYTAPSDSSDPNNTYRYLPGQLSTDGTYLFWVEGHERYSPGGGLFPPGFYPTGAGRLMKWKARTNLNDTDPFVTAQPIACQNCNGSYDMLASPSATANGWVYFNTSRGLARIRADAPAISWDIAVDGMEVTQGIQNLNNEAPLIANKPTVVRVYGRKLNGPTAMSVAALLYGADSNGNPLPGSPLRALNVTQNMFQNNVMMARENAQNGWLFQLPDSWITPGAKTFSPSLDPRKVFNDPNRENNNRNLGVTFTRKAPVCIVAVPVRTAAPAASHTDPGYRRQVDLLRKIFPISDVWMYYQNDDVAETQARFGIPPWEYGPYELPDDGGKVLQSLWWRDAFSDDPDACDDANAETHYVGLVHANTPMGNNLGLGRLDSAVSYTKLVSADRWDRTDYNEQRFNVLAHELGHNYGREHPRCGATEDIDNGYPYNPCMIDDRPLTDPRTYFGYDVGNFKPLDPSKHRDLMSYGSPYWVSDYTYRALFNRISNRAALQAVNQAQAELAAANAVAYLSGSIEHDAGTGSLEHAFVLPSAALSAGMRQKAQRMAASSAGLHHGAGEAHNYTVHLLDASGTELAQKSFSLPGNAPHDSPTDSQTFNLAIPAPTGSVATVELRDGTKVLASLKPGSNAPTINVITPAGGETFDAKMTLSWQASDADGDDKLLYTVQYSPDNGQTWRAILTSFPNPGTGDTVSVELANISALPSSTNTGLIRVAVSDGYNTTLSTSQPFTVVNRAPEASISAPAAASNVPAGQAVVLQGSAMDVEDGSLSGAALRWAVDGIAAGTGQTSVVAGLAPGEHTVTLTARDSAGKETTISHTFMVETLAIPQGNAPTLDGECDDETYAGGVRLPLVPYADGTQAHVQIIRSDTQLWACFSGLQRTSGTSPGSFATLRIDPNFSREASPQPDDLEYGVGEDGTIFVRKGSGGREAPVFGSADSRVSSNEFTWSAEMQIAADVLGGWNKVIGLMVDHNWVTFQGDDHYWPTTSGWDKPNTWARTMLGSVAQLTSLNPTAALAGSAALEVTLTGSNFPADAVAQWNGSVRPTTVVSATQLTMQISAADLVQAGTASVTVVSAASPGAPSNARPFFVTSLTPTNTPQPSGTRVLVPLVSR